MAWTDYFIGAITGAKVIISPEGRPFVSTEIAKGEFVNVELTTNETQLPFQVTFRSESEERIYGYASTKDLACKLALEVVQLRLNSLPELVDSPY